MSHAMHWRWQDEPACQLFSPGTNCLGTNHGEHETVELEWWTDSVPNALVVCFSGRLSLKLQVPIGWAKDFKLGHYQIPSLPPGVSLLREQMTVGVDLEQHVRLSTCS